MTDVKDQELPGSPIDRRALFQLLGAGSAAAILPGEAAANAPAFETENPGYQAFYSGIRGYYLNDPRWVEFTTPRLTWPTPRQRVPDLAVVIPNNRPVWLDAYRKWAQDAERLGIRYDIQQVSFSRWLEIITRHTHGDIEVHPASMRPERLDPSEFLTSRAYGKDRRSYGEWVNERYDALVEAQNAASDPQERLSLVRQAQKVLADDLYIQQFGWGPAILEAYNSGEWQNVVPVRGFGLAAFDAFHSFLSMTSRSGRNSVNVGITTLLETTNIFAATDNMRAVGRMIYDRLAYFDKDLNIVPWALESWTRVDDKAWDVKLRPGMTFHDGRPVTVQDLQFTFDFMRQYDRGIFWTANRFLEGTSILDESAGTLRFSFKEPYGPFASYFLQLNVILPKHIWQNIMRQQNVADDPRQIRMDRPIGSGPFKFGRHRRDTDLQLTAHEDHFSRPSVKEIWAIATPTVDGLLGRLQTGEIDFIESSNTLLTPSQAKQFDGSRTVSVLRTPDVNWYHGVCRASCLPWRDIEFRRAWNHSIDRKFLVEVAWEGEGREPTANTFFPTGNPWNNPELPPIPTFDLAKAREILEKASYSWDAEGRLLYPAAADAGFRDRVTRVCGEGYRWGGLKMLPG